MTEATGTLAVPGASLYYELSGSGPLLLVVQGGAGGAAGLARQLADAFTVVSYDRRGLARSPLDGPADAAGSIEQHAVPRRPPEVMGATTTTLAATRPEPGEDDVAADAERAEDAHVLGPGGGTEDYRDQPDGEGSRGASRCGGS